MNNIIETIYSGVNNLFTVEPLLLKPVRKDITRWIFAVYGIDLTNAKTTSIIKYPLLTVHFIQAENITFSDVIMIDNDPAIIIIVPSQMYNDDYDTVERVRIINNIYTYILDYMCSNLPQSSSLYKVYKVSPLFLTALTLEQFYGTKLDEYLQRNNIFTHNVTEQDVQYVLNNRDEINQFFGDGLILDMIKNKK